MSNPILCGTRATVDAINVLSMGSENLSNFTVIYHGVWPGRGLLVTCYGANQHMLRFGTHPLKALCRQLQKRARWQRRWCEKRKSASSERFLAHPKPEIPSLSCCFLVMLVMPPWPKMDHEPSMGCPPLIGTVLRIIQKSTLGEEDFSGMSLQIYKSLPIRG